MGTVRYGARPPEMVRNREVEATAAPIWSRAVTVVFETDPEAIAAVLPRPLEPSDPTARLRIAVVDMGTGLQTVRGGLVRRPGPARGDRGRVRAVHAHDHRAGHGRRPRDLRRAQEDRRGGAGRGGRDADGPHRPDGFHGGRGGRARSGPSGPATRSTSSTSTSSSSPTRRARASRAIPPSSTAAATRWPGWCARSSGECKLLEAPLDPIADFPVRQRRCRSTTPRSPRHSGARWSTGCRPNG